MTIPWRLRPSDLRTRCIEVIVDRLHRRPSSGGLISPQLSILPVLCISAASEVGKRMFAVGIRIVGVDRPGAYGFVGTTPANWQQLR